MKKQIASRSVVAMVVMTALFARAGLFDSIKNVATETITIKERPRRQNVKDVGGTTSPSAADQSAVNQKGPSVADKVDCGGASPCEQELATFIQRIGKKASSDNNAFVGVEVYKGIRLGMTERELHKIVERGCDDSFYESTELNYPSAKKNIIVKDKGPIGVVDVYLGGLDFEKNLKLQHLDEKRQNFLVTRVKFTINGAVENPGISEIENQFAKRFGGDVEISRTKRLIRDDGAPNGVREYPVVTLWNKAQKVVLTQSDLRNNVEVTATYEAAEVALRELRSSYEEKAKKEADEKAKKEALDF